MGAAHQEFPLTSRAKRVTVALAKPGGSTLSDTTYRWHAEQGTFGSWIVYSPATLEKMSGQAVNLDTFGIDQLSARLVDLV